MKRIKLKDVEPGIHYIIVESRDKWFPIGKSVHYLPDQQMCYCTIGGYFTKAFIRKHGDNIYVEPDIEWIKKHIKTLGEMVNELVEEVVTHKQFVDRLRSKIDYKKFQIKRLSAKFLDDNGDENE